MTEKNEPITNTEAQRPTPDGIATLLHNYANPGSIEASEAAGQAELCGTTSRLPTDFGMGDKGERKAALEKAGVKFLGPVEGDLIFQQVELPAGWKLKATDHSMWSHLLDEKGRIRANVFYKAAFYDRNAHTHVQRRYNTNTIYPDNFRSPGPFFATVTDGGENEIFRSEAFHDDQRLEGEGAAAKLSRELGWEEVDKLRGSVQADKAAKAYLDTNYPDWQDLGAYWD